MTGQARALALVADHCDLAERLGLVPPSARIRGVFYRNIERHLARVGKLQAYRSYFPDDRHGALPYYPLGDYLLRIAVAGAIVDSPERVHAGMFEICRDNATTFGESLLGRALFRLLSRDPLRLSEQAVAGRRQSLDYGRWTLVKHAPRRLEMVYEDEYQWIESVAAGSARGTYDLCDVPVALETTLTGRFSGSTLITW